MCHEPTPQEQNVSHGDTTSTLELVTLLNALYFAVLEIPLKRDAMDKSLWEKSLFMPFVGNHCTKLALFKHSITYVLSVRTTLTYHTPSFVTY